MPSAMPDERLVSTPSPGPPGARLGIGSAMAVFPRILPLISSGPLGGTSFLGWWPVQGWAVCELADPNVDFGVVEAAVIGIVSGPFDCFPICSLPWMRVGIELIPGAIDAVPGEDIVVVGMDGEVEGGVLADVDVVEGFEVGWERVYEKVSESNAGVGRIFL